MASTASDSVNTTINSSNINTIPPPPPPNNNNNNNNNNNSKKRSSSSVVQLSTSNDTTTTTTTTTKSPTTITKFGETEVFDLVCDYLSSKGLIQTETTLRAEFEGNRARELYDNNNNNNNNNYGNNGNNNNNNNHRINRPARLEDLLEKSLITEMVTRPKKKIRSHLDAMLDNITTDENENENDDDDMNDDDDDDINDDNDPETIMNNQSNNTMQQQQQKKKKKRRKIKEEDLQLATKLVNYNPCPNDPYGASSMPIYQTSTFAQPSATEFGEYDYTRSGNPTRLAFEQQIAILESGYRAFSFGTGMSALAAVTRLVKSGEEIILNDDSYGGTYRLLAKVADRQGIKVRYVDMSGREGPQRLEESIHENTRLVMTESPTNPMQRVCDIKKLAEICHRNRMNNNGNNNNDNDNDVGGHHHTLLSVDNTMMSPILMNPLKLGADIVIHSATKFIGGHADTMAGIICVSKPELAEQIYFFQNAEGTGIAPFDAWLMLRGVKTMQIRVEKQQSNAQLIAEFLNEHPVLNQIYQNHNKQNNTTMTTTTTNKLVYYTGLNDFKDADLHNEQARGAGSVVCFRTFDLKFSQHIVSMTKLFKITVSFGSVNSLISLPGAMSHASIPAEVRSAREFPEDLIRMAIGIEDVNDLIQDLDNAILSYHEKLSLTENVNVKEENSTETQPSSLIVE